MVMGLLAGCGASTADVARQIQAIDGVENAKVDVRRPGAPWNRTGMMVVQVAPGADYRETMVASFLVLAQAFPDDNHNLVATFTTDSDLNVTASTTPLPGMEELIESLPFYARPLDDSGVSANPGDILAWAKENGYVVE